MTILGALTTSTLGMKSQSHAMNTIGLNLANVNTGGYKRTETNFTTYLAKTMYSNSDIGGVRPLDYARIDQQGTVVSSHNNLDISINGEGMLILNTKIDGSGETLYTRDGSLQMAIGEYVTVNGADGNPTQVRTGYLTDKNGYFVQGWSPDADGTFSNSGSMSSLRVDAYAFAANGLQTSNAALVLNIPSDNEVGESNSYKMNVYDTDGVRRSVDVKFTKSGVNEWTASASVENGTVTSLPQTMYFTQKGELDTETALTAQFSDAIHNIQVDWDNGETSNVDLNIEDITQFASGFLTFSFTRDGFGKGGMEGFSFDDKGHVVGQFEDTSGRKIYKLPLAVFTNPNQLDARSGNTYAEGLLSGDILHAAAGADGFAIFSPFSREISNVNMADEFSRMIMTQNAYNAATTSFKTVDEMLQAARDLKR